MHHKCPSKEDSSGILVAGLEDRNQKALDFMSVRMEDTSKSADRDKYKTVRQKFFNVKESTENTSFHDDDAETTRTRRSVPVSAIVIDDVDRHVVVDDVEDEGDASDMVVEEEDDVDHFVTSRRVLTHNNNGSVIEKKSRLRKPQEIRRVIRLANTASPPASMIVTNPLPIPPAALVLPEQTEPEDLSMSTGNVHRLNHNGYRNRHSHSNSHSSGDSRSPSSGADEEEEEDLPPSSTGLFLQQRHPKFRRHHPHLQRSNGSAPVS
jgi:hypothetical protein